MRNDVKIGMIAGVVLAVTATLIISNRPGENIESRITRSFQNPPVSDDTATDKKEPTTENVTPRSPIEPPPKPAIDNTPKPRYHIVEKGETLSSIAADYYGNRNQVDRIVQANPYIITDANNIRPGMRLLIPR